MRDLAVLDLLERTLHWHKRVISALERHRAEVLRAIDAGEAVENEFLGLTRQEVEHDFDGSLLESDRHAVLGFLAAGEAGVREDFRVRVKRGGNQSLSWEYRKWRKKLKRPQRKRPPFDDDGILDVLRQTDVIHRDLIGGFRQCLPARHWLAHGRLGPQPQAINQFPPGLIYHRTRALLIALKGVPR